jgi:hypothetical protein
VSQHGGEELAGAFRSKTDNPNKVRKKMKKVILTIIMAALGAGVGCAADVSVGADVASAYVFRGTTLNDGLVVQPYAEVGEFPIPEEYGSLTMGMWANFDIGDYGGTLDDNQFSEIDYYLTYPEFLIKDLNNF